MDRHQGAALKFHYAKCSILPYAATIEKLEDFGGLGTTITLYYTQNEKRSYTRQNPRIYFVRLTIIYRLEWELKSIACKGYKFLQLLSLSERGGLHKRSNLRGGGTLNQPLSLFIE